MGSSGSAPSDDAPEPARRGDDHQTSGDRGQTRSEETAAQRDQAAEQRDALAAERDRDAMLAEQRALELDHSDALSDRRPQRASRLRARGRDGRERAAHDRERATGDRRRAADDRELAATDREEARQDRKHAGTDELTGAHERGAGLEELQRDIDRALRLGEKLVAAYIDVDGLKQVNDRRGHGAGDDLLRAVAEGLRHHLRSYDLLVRLGGDEFLCVLLGITVGEARRRFDALRSELARGPTAGSVSVGLAELCDDDEPRELINRADRDLLAARSE